MQIKSQSFNLKEKHSLEPVMDKFNQILIHELHHDLNDLNKNKHKYKLKHIPDYFSALFQFICVI